MEKEPTTKEIMVAVEKLGKNVDESMGELHEAIGEFSNRVDARFEKLESRMDSMEGKVDSMETRMVTKDYLDEKLFDLRGDLSSIIRKEDKKVESLIEVLYKKKVISKDDKEQILSMEPFPKLT